MLKHANKQWSVSRWTLHKYRRTWPTICWNCERVWRAKCYQHKYWCQMYNLTCGDWIFISSGVSSSGNDSRYISAVYSDGIVQVFTLPEFANYEWQETSINLLPELIFNCLGETRSVTFFQPIKVVNNFEPAFSESSYEIVIPTPLPSEMDLSCLMGVSKVNFCYHSGDKICDSPFI